MRHYSKRAKAKAVAGEAPNMALRLFVATMTALCILALATAAKAQVIEGCDPNVMAAAQAKAQARVAYDTAVTEETIDKPDSVLAMTCFNNLSGWAADGTNGGGAIFSGDFRTLPGFSQVIGDGLQGFFDDFVDASGNDSGVVDYAATTPTASTTCTETQDHWGEIKLQGVQKGVPYPVLSDLGGWIDPATLAPGAVTTPAGSGTNFTSNWGVSSGTDNLFSGLNTALGSLTPPLIPAFTPTQTSCLTLQAAGVTGTCP
jgi:hypothetical protein